MSKNVEVKRCKICHKLLRDYNESLYCNVCYNKEYLKKHKKKYGRKKRYGRKNRF